MAKKMLNKYEAWQMPDEQNLKQEYKVEYQLKPGLKREIGNVWSTYEDFLQSVGQGKVIKFDNKNDNKVMNRSHTVSKQGLMNLISGYASYPEFRNEKTVDNLYNRISANQPLNLPIILKMPNGVLRIMSGNTRADVAKQLVGYYKALVIPVPTITSNAMMKEEKQTMSIFKKIFLTEQSLSDITKDFDPTIPVTVDIKPFPTSVGTLVEPIAEEALHSKVVEPFSGEKYAELGAMVGMLEGLSVLFQTLHWQINGNSFYGDHLMFQRIYEATDEQIDGVAERAVGLGTRHLADSSKIVKSMDIFLDHIRSNTVMEMNDIGYSFAKRGKYALEMFIETVEKMYSELKEKGLLTSGLDNLIQGILDVQEGHLFLLKQRLGV